MTRFYNQYYGKWDYQQQYKSILEAAMVSTPEGFTYNIPMLYGPSVPVKNPSAIKSLCKCLETLDVKQNNAVYRLGADKSKHK